MATVAGIQTGYHELVDRLIATTTKLENDMKEVSGRVGASLQSATPGTTGRLSVTGMKGFEKLKAYTGDATQWNDWLFKVTTWLENVNRSFKTLLPKLNVSETEPQEPEEGHRMKAGLAELTTEEE